MNKRQLVNLAARVERIVDFIALRDGGSLKRVGKGLAALTDKQGDAFAMMKRVKRKEVYVGMMQSKSWWNGRPDPTDGRGIQRLGKHLRNAVQKGNFRVTAVPNWTGRIPDGKSKPQMDAVLEKIYKRGGMEDDPARPLERGLRMTKSSIKKRPSFA